MSDRQNLDCGCCNGVGGETPRRLDNPPGKSTLSYRIGRHRDYLAAMQARLSSSRTPALTTLTTREASDLSLAITDALACSLDVLGFYTERYAQEHYLRSATEHLSVREMARLIGYRLKPGVAAATHLAFTLQDIPGQNIPGAPILIPRSTRVQSVPGQDEQAQTFETVTPAPARAAWNALPVQHDEARSPAFGDTELWLTGANTRLEVGDLLLIVGGEHLANPSDERWDVRFLTEVEPFPERELTRVGWAEGLGHTRPFVLPAGAGIRVYTFRGRTTVFGANAPDWRALSDESKASYLGLLTSTGATNPRALTAADHEEWPEFTVLAPVYPERHEDEPFFFDEPISLETLPGSGAPQAAGSDVQSAQASSTGQSAGQAAGQGQQAAQSLADNQSGQGTRRPPLARSPDRIDISPINESVVAGGWALLAVPDSIELYRITEATNASRAEYLLTGQTTRLRLRGKLPDGRLPPEFEQAVRALAVYVQSEELTLARAPLASPLYGDRISLDDQVEDLVPGQALALRGKRPRVMITRASRDLRWLSDDGEQRLLGEGDSLVLVEPPERLIRFQPIVLSPRFGGAARPALAQPPKRRITSLRLNLNPDAFAATIGRREVLLRLVLKDRDGKRGQVELQGSDIGLREPEEKDPEEAEIVFLATTADAVTQGRTRGHLQLAKALRHCYFRRGTRLNANVAPATHGETVEALLGSGDGSAVNQSFLLNQAPLTYVSAETPSGVASTLQVRINDVLWQEQSSLYQAAPDARVYRTRQHDAGVTTIEFGDGVEGARLPSGESNVRAHYRKGLGVAGNVGAGKLTTLLTRPLGVAEATNPEAATGGEDGETLERARSNAPLTVLTLERAVSITDYADYARAFAGIDKAHALWIPAGPARGVFLTIAGVDGAAVPETSDTYANLAASLRSFGDPLVPLRIVNHRDARFRCRLAVKVLADYETDRVLEAVAARLRAHFAFARRDFEQSVSVDEVAAVAQAVPGVLALHVTRLHRSAAAPRLEPRLFAALPIASLNAMPEAAELLTLNNDPIELEVLP